MRSGLLASVGGARPSGSSFILEDVCFPPERLADGALDLQALFAKHGYAGIIFGHASAGNLHFLITPFLNDPKEVAHYGTFMHDVVELVVGKYDGSLKAEHGTGRNIAPYVEREWGTKLSALVWRLKRLADPENILSPGVPDGGSGDTSRTCDCAHHRGNRRPLHQCGFASPSVRVALDDYAASADRPAPRWRDAEASKVSEKILADYDYDAIQTCAAMGRAIACPVDINTGALMKYSPSRARPGAERLAAAPARRFAAWNASRALQSAPLMQR